MDLGSFVWFGNHVSRGPLSVSHWQIASTQGKWAWQPDVV